MMEQLSSDTGICVICNELLELNGTSTLTEKGKVGLEKAAKERNETLSVKAGQKIHTDCRKIYTNARIIALKRKEQHDGISNSKLDLRSKTTFSFQEDCLFCGKSIVETCRVREYKEHYKVRSYEFQTEICDKATERTDDWGDEVLARIEYSRDLHASDAVYHQTCSIKFRTGQDKPSDNPQSAKKRRMSVKGRQKDTVRETAFMKVVNFLERNDDEQITVSELVEKMTDYLDGESESFTPKWMRKRLEEHFGDDIVISSVQKKENVVTFRRKASKILHEFHKLPGNVDPETEKMNIVKAAAELIKSDIKSCKLTKDVYPSPEDIEVHKSLAYLPDSLRYLLEVMFVGQDTDNKVAAIGQAVMQAVRPRTIIPPLQIAVGIQLHQHFNSKFMIETLHNIGFCSSYKEVQRYEQNAAVQNDSEIPRSTADQFIQYVADNVDHNIQTIDGHGTFHGMGIIASATPGGRAVRHIPRRQISVSDLNSIGKINISFYSQRKVSDMIYEPLHDLSDVGDATANIDFLWKTSWLLQNERTSWSGAMQMINGNGEYPGRSSVIFMPMIDLNPSDETCIYSTLSWVCEHAKRYDATPVLTFDQPLWFKATMIVNAEPTNSDLSKIVVRLGAFHTEMSFLGAIGHIMNDSGLYQVLTTVYGENAVGHMLSGKAVARALRGHGLVHMALQSLIISDVFNLELSIKTKSEQSITEIEQHSEESDPLDDDHETKPGIENEIVDEQKATDTQLIDIDEDLDSALKLFDRVLTGDTSIKEACSDQRVDNIKCRIKEYCYRKSEESRTARLWLQYIEMVELLRQFIKAERTGNWQLHLKTLRSMLPYLAAAGHNLYTKSAYLYLAKMDALESTHPQLHDYFMKGYHVIRRSDRYWAGLPTDLVIEQMLMRSLKSAGGLTRGRGMTDIQRAVWVLSRPATSAMNEAMQNFSGEIYTSSDQHKDTSPSMRNRDKSDTEDITEYVYERNPFKTEIALKSITTGVVSYDGNVDQASEIGMKIVNNMIGKKINEFVFRKKDAVVPMNDKSAVKIDGETVKIDPQLLFQRLVSAADRYTDSDENEIPLAYELCTHPPALFETPRQMREADKPNLANALKSNGNPGHHIPDTTTEWSHVIDGGMLLQWLPWESGQSFDQICETYIRFLKSRYSNLTIVFDGYDNGPSTKDNTHLRRTTGLIGTEVKFTESSTFRGKKSIFLANYKNKQTFINMLSDRMSKNGIKTEHANADADLLIVLTTVKCSMSAPTVLVGDDTDLLVLLCYHASPQSKPLYFRPRHKMNQADISWDIHQLQNHLGINTCRNILFLHAILGCDTTSKVYGLGKGIALKAFEKSDIFRQAASTFLQQPVEVSKEDVLRSGETALIYLYKGASDHSLDSLRVSKFNEKVAKSSIFVDPKQLPPTSDAAQFHSMRVYLQVQDWKGDGTTLNPLDWGWELMDGRLFPMTMTKAPAPLHILRVVRCTCVRGCRTKACSCRKVGLECSFACATCKGMSCENRITQDIVD